MDAPTATFNVLNVTLNLTTDDERFVEEFESVFGGRAGGGFGDLPAVTLDVTLSRIDERTSEVVVHGDDVDDGAAFLLQFSSATIPLRRVETDAPWIGVAVGDEEEPLFRFRGDVCHVRRAGRWRRILAHFLFLRMLRMRKEAMFFHAASVGINGSGVLLIGPKGSGKSTLSLGLASRGHDFLGDETAAYVSSQRSLIPFRRPAGIKPGPRATAVARSVERVGPPADEDGMLRVDAGVLFPLKAARSLPLQAVIFLGAFGGEARLELIQAGREELALMQPIATTLSNASASTRVFEMIRLLGSVSCYRLTAGTPDETVDVIENAFS
jgi:hypothetical protein